MGLQGTCNLHQRTYLFIPMTLKLKLRPCFITCYLILLVNLLGQHYSYTQALRGVLLSGLFCSRQMQQRKFNSYNSSQHSLR
jgi:hypothetical protein